MVSKKRIMRALKRTKGRVYLAAELLDCVPKTIYNAMERWPELREAKDDAEGLRLVGTQRA